jgi:hypothetical protein
MPNRDGRRLRSSFGRALVFAALGLLALLASGDAVGRFRLVPTPARNGGTSYSKSDLLVLVPTASQRLRVGDVIIAKHQNEHSLLKVSQIVDTDGPVVRFANDSSDQPRRLGGNTWRVAGSMPLLGLPLNLLAGPIQSIVLCLAGLALIMRAEFGRARYLGSPGRDAKGPLGAHRS